MRKQKTSWAKRMDEIELEQVLRESGKGQEGKDKLDAAKERQIRKYRQNEWPVFWQGWAHNMLSTGNARKNDRVDALATALAASRNQRLAAVDPEAASEAMRLLSERGEDLVAERTRALNRLHALLRHLLPGGVARTLSAERAARILRGIRPRGASARLRRRLASEILRLESARWTGRSPT